MTARKVKVHDLEPGMVTRDWVVIGDPFVGEDDEGREVDVVRMRHRVDGGESDIYYNPGTEVTVIEEEEMPA